MVSSDSCTTHSHEMRSKHDNHAKYEWHFYIVGFTYALPSLDKNHRGTSYFRKLHPQNKNMEAQNESLLFNPSCFVQVTISFFVGGSTQIDSDNAQFGRPRVAASRTPSKLQNWCNCWRRWDEVVSVPLSCAMAERWNRGRCHWTSIHEENGHLHDFNERNIG